MLSETRERFITAILAEVPAESIEEIHFFQPIRQGGVESGVAVVAAVENITQPSDDGEDPITEEDPRPDASRRFAVYTALYRLVLKGPDRGTWSVSVVAEADAPLLTVDAVVRGVQRRSGDLETPERVSGDELRALHLSGSSVNP